jgi:hypothetical protein
MASNSLKNYVLCACGRRKHRIDAGQCKKCQYERLAERARLRRTNGRAG